MRIYNIIQFMEKICAKMPDEIAVIDEARSLTFSELRNCALNLADKIYQRLGNIRQPVAVWAQKSLESVIADLAILYAGCAYMNLDVKNPPSRIQAIDKRVNPPLYLLGQNPPPAIENIEGRMMAVNLDELNVQPGTGGSWALAYTKSIIDTDLMCLINTSGSTGEPKTVALCHRSFIDFIAALQDAGIAGKREIIGSMAPIIFDHFSFELCAMMAFGSTLLLLPEMLPSFPVRLLEYIKERHVSFIFWVPTIMVNIANLNLLEQISLPDLKTVFFAGEVFPTARFNYWRKALSDALFVNLYGPTEITVDCLYYRADRILEESSPVPLGIPFNNTDILLLDEDGKVVPQGETGEICVRGSSLALGYYNFPEKTQAVFKQNPLNNAYPDIIYHTGDLAYIDDAGQYIFRGRKDYLIKHLGYRIELGEVEHAVNRSGLVENCCSLYDYENKKIILIYQGGEDISPRTFHQNLSKWLPRYALPAVFVRLEELPRNANGKIDRSGLKKRFL